MPGWSALYSNVCTQTSISTCLPYQMTLKDQRTKAVIDVSASSIDYCRRFSVDHKGFDTLVECRYTLKRPEQGVQRGKYLQLRHPINSQVILQKDYPDEVLCSDDLSRINVHLKSGSSGASGTVLCSDLSFSQCLPYAAVYWNRLTNTIVNTHYVNVDLCAGIADNGKNNSTMETVSPCRLKTLK